MENYVQRLLDIWGSDSNDHRQALDWIEKTIERRAEEGLYLDFKQKSDRGTPALSDDDKGNLAKAISGFANTDGGLIVWGLKRKPATKKILTSRSNCYRLTISRRFKRGSIPYLEKWSIRQLLAWIIGLCSMGKDVAAPKVSANLLEVRSKS